MANPNPTSAPPPPQPPPLPITIDNDNDTIAASEFLTQREVLTRRSKRVKQLARLYKTHYWILMEELKRKHREYYWLYGKSPLKEDEKNNNTQFINNNNNNVGSGTGEKEVEVEICAVSGCKAKAMALTRFCFQHILSDSKQKLYKGCSYAIKSTQTGPILCGKPVLRSTIPSFCPIHFQKAEKHLARALKKAGLNVSSPNKLAPKLHVMVAEFVRQIQTKRRAAQKAAVVKIEIKEEGNS